MITGRQMFEKSMETVVSHRLYWEGISEIRRCEFEAYAEMANQLFAEQMKFDRKCDEIAVGRKLLISNFPTKWKQAKDAAMMADKDTYAEKSAVDLACRLFLEFGGKTSN